MELTSRLATSETRRRAAPLAVSSPLLILLALVGFCLRQGNARWQALPALLIGSGLLITSIVRRRRRRAELLRCLRQAAGARGIQPLAPGERRPT